LAQSVITFDGKQKQYLKLEAPYVVLKQVINNVPGTHLSRDKRYIRCTRDEMSCYYIMKYSGCQPSKEVLDWLYECKHHRERLAYIFSNIEEGFKLSTGYEAWLHKYQTCDVKFMIEAKKCINANDLGLGKTVEAIAACDELFRENQRVLVICTKSLMYMWADEFRKWSNLNTDVIVCEEQSSYKKREKLQAKIEAEARIKIISYSLLNSEKWPQLFAKPWDIIICDEAHKLKNPDTKQTQNFMKLQSEYLWLLSATPDPNGDLEEVYGMLRCLDPQRFTSKWAFIERYGIVEEDEIYTKDRTITVKKVSGIKEEAKPILHRLLIPYMFRRKKKDKGVHENLPDAIYRTITLELNSYERKIYDDLLEEMISKLEESKWIITKNVLERNVRLRMLLLNPVLIGGKDQSTKTEALLDIIDSVPGQVIVFTNFKSYTRYLEDKFASSGISALRIDGDIPPAEVRQREKEFQAGNAKVIFGTIGKMGEGLNLQTAQALVMCDKSYVPKDNNQAIGRILRPGQKTSPVIYSLVAKNTIDEIVEEINTTKQQNINEIEAFQYLVDALKEVYLK